MPCLSCRRMLHAVNDGMTEKWLQSAADEYGLIAGMAFSERDLNYEAQTKAAMHCLKDMDDFIVFNMRATKHDFDHPAAYRLMTVIPDVSTYNKRNHYEVRPPTKAVFRKMYDSHVFRSQASMQLERMLEGIQPYSPVI